MGKNLTNPGVYEKFTHLSSDESLSSLSTSLQGLNKDHVKERLKQYGLNLLKPNQTSLITILLRQFKSPFIFILIFAAILAYSLGEMIDGTIIILFVLINAILGFYQENNSEQAIKTLNKYTTPNTHVIREGETQTIPTSSLVPGDIILLQPGDIVPADIRLLTTSNFTVDESLLTGESQPCEKQNTPLAKANVPLDQALNIAFSGTSVTSGQATGVVIATGLQVYIGTIAKLTVETTRVSSFEKGMGRFSTFILKMIGITLFMVFFTNLLIKGPTADIGDLILFIIALAAAVIPEALPLVITFSLSRGAMNLSKHKVVVKRLSAVEDLGSIEVLCTDKTGTITENKLTVASIFGKAEEVLFHANAGINHNSKQLDPFDIAIQEKYQKLQPASAEVKRIFEIPFDPERKRNSVLFTHKKSSLLVVRGAAEALLPYASQKDKALTDWISSEQQEGRRVIMVAHKNMPTTTAEYNLKAEEKGLIISGAISFTDPIKKSAPDAIRKAQELGIVIKVITGDGAVTAGKIAKEIGLIESTEDVITAEDFFALPPKKQKAAADRMHVFARFSPVQKYQLIELLQQDHEVGFMGDGINDAPALKIANVALVVQGASDIARESADVILLNSSLSVVVNGIQEGREVFANTIKYVKLTLASNFGNFYAIAIVTFFVDFLPMLPVQILLANLLSDFPLIAVSTDSVDREEIKKPGKYDLKDFALTAVIFGIVSSVFDFIFFGAFYRISPEVLQTNWFIGTILTELVLLYSLRTRKLFFKTTAPSRKVVVMTLIAALVTIAIPFTAWGQAIFSFIAPSMPHLLIVLGITLAYFFINEIVKVSYYRLSARQNGSSSAKLTPNPIRLQGN